MICKRCGNDLSENTLICPTCGTAIDRPASRTQQATSYGSFSQYDFGALPSDHINDPRFPTPFNAGKSQLPPYTAQQAIPGYIPSYHRPQPGYLPFHNSTPPSFRSSALIAEFILSLFGLFGIGWLIAGSTATGIILLVCSIFIYWPIMIAGVMFTRGIGLLCLGPIAIAAIILNILLLSISMRHKAMRFTPAPPAPPSSEKY